MFGQFWRHPDRSGEELRILVTLARETVLAVEQTCASPGVEKKRIALAMLTDLSRDFGLKPSALLLDTVIESSIRFTDPPLISVPGTCRFHDGTYL